MNYSDLNHQVTEDRDLALLNEFAARISKAMSLTEVLDETVKSVTAILKYDVCAIYLPEGKDLVLRATSTLSPADGQHRTSISMQNVGFESTEVVVIQIAAYADPRYRLFTKTDEDRFEMFLSIPMLSSGRLIGLINVCNRAPKERTDRDIYLISTLVSLVGVEINLKELNRVNELLTQELRSREDFERATRDLRIELELTHEDACQWLQKPTSQTNRTTKAGAHGSSVNSDLKRAFGSICDGPKEPSGNSQLLS